MKQRPLLSILLCLFLLCGLCGCNPISDSPAGHFSDAASSYADGLTVDYIDVGQGDAALVRCGDQAMLIDGGSPKASSIIYTYLEKQNVRRLDYILASHADSDHIGGLLSPLSTMPVDHVLIPKTASDSKTYQSFLSKTKEKGISLTHPKSGDSFMLGDSTVFILGPITEDPDDRNNGSIVAKICYGQTSFLFTGDAERKEEQELLDAGFDLSATVLKVGHHGSKNSTTYLFLRAVMPKYAVISVGDNSYGHPTEAALSRLRDADSTVLRTDLDGDIIIKSDGTAVTVTTKKHR